MKHKHKIKQFLNAKKAQLLKKPALASLHDRLHGELLWHLNRRSFAGGIALGLFCAFIPLPAQMILAAVLAILFQVNFPMALIATWFSNPLTYGPLLYICYQLGAFVMRLYGHSTTQVNTDSILGQIHLLGTPIIIGCLMTGILMSGIGYLLANVYWRFMVLRRYNKRHKKRLG